MDDGTAKQLILVLLGMVMFGTFGIGTVAALNWTTETIDSGGYGEYTSIALTAGNEPRISYYDRVHGDLRFARNNYDGGGWKIETVDSGGDVGQHTSLVLDSNGNPRISYYDYTNGALKYVAYTGSAWTVQVVDTAGDVGLFTSLSLNSAGEPFISYYSQSEGDLKYAAHTSAGWQIETVDAPCSRAMNPTGGGLKRPGCDLRACNADLPVATAGFAACTGADCKRQEAAAFQGWSVKVVRELSFQFRLLAVN